MTSILFLGFVAAMAGVVIWTAQRHLPRRAAFLLTGALLVGLVYVAAIGQSGVLQNTTLRPPATLFILGPVAFFLVTMTAWTIRAGQRGLPGMIPLSLLLGFQSFRVIVELFIHQLWREGIVPQMLTYSGANVDIWIGASAPFIAWLSTHGRWGLRLSLVWNGVGLLALLNVVSRAILSSPGPLNFIHTPVPNLMFGTFPYMFIPGFFVPLAVTLHLQALRKTLVNLSSPSRHDLVTS